MTRRRSRHGPDNGHQEQLGTFISYKLARKTISTTTNLRCGSCGRYTKEEYDQCINKGCRAVFDVRDDAVLLEVFG